MMFDTLVTRNYLYRLASMPVLNALYRAYVWSWYVNKDFPRRIGIEITDRCNTSCINCPSQRLEKKGNIAIAIIEKLAKETARFNQNVEFVLHKMGEPLLNEQLWDITGIIKKRKPASTLFLTTNGILLKENIGKIIDGKIDILKISIGAAFSDTYKAIHGNDALKSIEDGICELLAARRKERPTIIVQLIETKETKSEVGAFIKKWSRYPVLVNISFEENWNGAIDNTYQGRGHDYLTRYPCLYLWTHPQINVDGTVSACPTDWSNKLIIGDFKKDALADIWNGSEINKLRKQHLQNDCRSCERCNSWLIFPSAFTKKMSAKF